MSVSLLLSEGSSVASRNLWPSVFSSNFALCCLLYTSGVSLSYSYKLIRRLNAELEADGFVTIKGLSLIHIWKASHTDGTSFAVITEDVRFYIRIKGNPGMKECQDVYKRQGRGCYFLLCRSI